ncbi:hypothetical protein GF337_20550 [candidate division KSB1 bacterium]|nr:hypothetical protein [candidate division KSB1 bacterium]
MSENTAATDRSTFMAAVADHAENKKLISRIITFIIMGIAVYEELFLESGINDNWMELTKWCLLYYFSRSAVEKVAKYVSAKQNNSQN